MSEWKPINTAPKGLGILGWNKADGHLVYRAAHGGWVAEYDREGVADDPTHWKPLPDPPSAV